MATMDSYIPGTPCWVDLGAPDLAAAADFYSGLFGWECAEGDPDFGGYRSCTLGGRTVAGLAPLMGPVSAWTTYIATADAKASMDPGGSAFGLWQPGLHIGAQAVNEPGAWTWSELMTRDLEGAKAFYPAVFGWTVDSDATPGYTVWQVDGRAVGGGMDMPEAFPPRVPSHWNTYFAVADCDAACAKVTELGGTVRTPPADMPGIGRIAVAHGLGHESFSLITTADSTG